MKNKSCNLFLKLFFESVPSAIFFSQSIEFCVQSKPSLRRRMWFWHQVHDPLQLAITMTAKTFTIILYIEYVSSFHVGFFKFFPMSPCCILIFLVSFFSLGFQKRELSGVGILQKAFVNQVQSFNGFNRAYRIMCVSRMLSWGCFLPFLLSFPIFVQGFFHSIDVTFLFIFIDFPFALV